MIFNKSLVPFIMAKILIENFCSCLAKDILPQFFLYSNFIQCKSFNNIFPLRAIFLVPIYFTFVAQI